MGINNASKINSSTVVSSEDASGTSSKFLTLCIFWVLIVVGNSLVIGVHRIYQRKQIPDYLIQILAALDLINAFGPVTISIAMYKAHPQGFLGLSDKTLCYFYNSAATMLRLSACFVMTAMALDRAISVDMPVYYRAVLQMKTVQRWVALLLIIAFIIACLPLAGASRILPYQTVCSFDFGSPYAAFIAIIGYLQLVIVLVSYVIILKGLFNFVERQIARRENRSLAKNRNIRMKLADRRKSSSGLVMKDIKSFRICKEFAKMTGLISLLFYISWIPIVLSITVQLKTGKTSEILQLLSARMSITGSVGNPIVYALLSAKYRKGYWYCIQRVACLCGAPSPKHPSKESAIALMLLQNRRVTPQHLCSPFYITGRDQRVEETPIDTRGTCSRKQLEEVAFESNVARYKEKAIEYENSDEENVNNQVSIAIEMQTGFDGDAEDSDHGANETLPAKRPLHLAINESHSTPSVTRVKRRRLKRRTQSEEITSNWKGNRPLTTSVYLDIPRPSIDSDCRRDIEGDTDSTDLEADTSTISSRNVRIHLTGVNRDKITQ